MIPSHVFNKNKFKGEILKNKKDSKRIIIPENTIAAGCRHTVGLKSDGTVTAVGNNRYHQCDVSGWRDIKLPCN